MTNKIEMDMWRELPKTTPFMGVFAFVKRFEGGGWSQIFFPKNILEKKKIKKIKVIIEWEDEDIE